MIASELFSILHLIRSENVGPLTFHALMRQFGSATVILENWEELPKKFQKKIVLAPLPTIEEELENSIEFGVTLLTYLHPLYPELLKEIPDFPPLLSTKGNLSLLSDACLGIVGSRNASIHGCKLAYQIARDLGEHSWKTVSGLARGIDTAAHKGSLEYGTIAFLAGGIDIVYPEENKKLYEEISEKGLLLTESAFGTAPQAPLFPRRNRLISGISKGVLVIEAAIQSGSLITAKYALDQGREVFSVPGSPLDPRARGPNHLLKQGATLVEDFQDILQAFPLAAEPPLAPPFFEEIKDSEISSDFILDHLSVIPLSIDDLLQATGLPLTSLWPTLLDLEIQGKIERHPGNQISRIVSMIGR
jgi:DNA processing protein